MSPEQASAVLGVSADATIPEVEDAYKELASIFQVQRVELMEIAEKPGKKRGIFGRLLEHSHLHFTIFLGQVFN